MNRIFLKERLFSFKMDVSKGLEENIDDFNEICMDLVNLGEQLDTENQAVILLNSLLEKYKEVKSTINYDRDSLTLDIVLDSLRSKELELRIEKKKTTALYTKNRQLKGQQSKQNRQNSRANQKGNQKEKEKMTCNYCHKEGHLKWDCPILKRKGKLPIKKENNVSANVLEGYESAEVLMVSGSNDIKEWIMDSGCTFHMSPHKHFFTKIKEFDGGKVVMGNNQQCDIKGIGSVKFQMDDGSFKILASVKYVPGLKRNLISLGTLDKSGFSYKSEGGNLMVCKDSVVKMKGVLKNGLYVLMGSSVSGELNAVSDKISKVTQLWQKRMCHISQKGLDILYKQDLISNHKPSQMPFCDHCVLGKATRLSFSSASHRSEGKVDYILSDLWGPSKVKSLGGAR